MGCGFDGLDTTTFSTGRECFVATTEANTEPRCRADRAVLDELNKRLLAFNPEAVSDGSAVAAALRHVRADSGFTLRTVPMSCGERKTLNAAPCPAHTGFRWSSPGGKALISFIVISCIVALFSVCWCVRLGLKRRYGLAEPSADVSKSPSTIQIVEMAGDESRPITFSEGGKQYLPAKVRNFPGRHT
jgi:hypothetical protein